MLYLLDLCSDLVLAREGSRELVHRKLDLIEAPLVLPPDVFHRLEALMLVPHQVDRFLQKPQDHVSQLCLHACEVSLVIESD